MDRPRGSVLIDGRYLWDREAVERAGLSYLTLSAGSGREAQASANGDRPVHRVTGLVEEVSGRTDANGLPSQAAQPVASSAQEDGN